MFGRMLRFLFSAQPGEERQAKYVVITLSSLFLLVLWIGFSFTAMRQRELEVDRVRDGLVRHEAAVLLEIEGLLKQVEIFLIAADEWIVSHEANPRRDPRFARLVDAFERSTGYLALIRLVDVDGSLHLIPGLPTGSPVNVNDREYVREARKLPPGSFYLGQAIQGRMSGRFAIPLVRTMPAGKHGVGVIFAQIDMQRLQKRLAERRYLGAGELALAHQRGYVLAETRQGVPGLRKPPDESREGGVFFLDGQQNVLLATANSAEFPIQLRALYPLDHSLQVLNDNVNWMAVLLILVTGVTVIGAGRAVSLIGALGDSRESLQKQVATDALTGVISRRHFLRLAEQEVDRASRYGQPVSLLYIDIDHFKLVNDRYGHRIGDTALLGVAKACQEVVRDIDVVARIGGEEFVILMPATGIEAARLAAERLRIRISSRPLDCIPGGLSMTVSIGVAGLRIEGSNALDDLLQRADGALYQAKESGRNRVCLEAAV